MSLLSSSRVLSARNLGTAWNLALELGLQVLMESTQFISNHIHYSGSVEYLLGCQLWTKCYEDENKFVLKSFLSR